MTPISPPHQDPIAKDPARIGTSATLSATNTPVSSSSMLAGGFWAPWWLLGRGSSGIPKSFPTTAFCPPQASPHCHHRSPWAPWPSRLSSPHPAPWVLLFPPLPPLASNPDGLQVFFSSEATTLGCHTCLQPPPGTFCGPSSGEGVGFTLISVEDGQKNNNQQRSVLGGGVCGGAMDLQKLCLLAPG